MHWLSFVAGFVAFPIVAFAVLGTLGWLAGLYDPPDMTGARDRDGRLL